MNVRKTVKANSVFRRVDFLRFIKKHPELQEHLKTEKDFNAIVKAFNERIALEMQLNPCGVIFPETNYIMFIANIGQPKRKVLNRKLTNQYKKDIFYTNAVTDGNLMKIMFLSKTVESRVENSALFSFYGSSKMKSKCSRYFLYNWLNCVTHILR